jgi:hypothetical protein
VGTLSIYDALGNLIVRNKKMGYYKEKKMLLYGWTGRNTKGRIVGGGSYLVIAKTTSYIKDTDPRNRILKVFLGIKERY